MTLKKEISKLDVFKASQMFHLPTKVNKSKYDIFLIFCV